MLVGAGLVPIVGLVVGALGRRIGEIDARIREGDSRIDRHGERISALEAGARSVMAMRSDITEVHRRVDDLPVQIGRLEGELAALSRTSSMILQTLVKDSP